MFYNDMNRNWTWLSYKQQNRMEHLKTSKYTISGSKEKIPNWTRIQNLYLQISSLVLYQLRYPDSFAGPGLNISLENQCHFQSAVGCDTICIGNWTKIAQLVENQATDPGSGVRIPVQVWIFLLESDIIFTRHKL